MFLEIKGIKKHFGGEGGDSRIEVLKGIDMEIERRCVLLGLGSGKSTLLKQILGELTVQTAAILQLMAERQPIWTKRH